MNHNFLSNFCFIPTLRMSRKKLFWYWTYYFSVQVIFLFSIMLKRNNVIVFLQLEYHCRGEIRPYEKWIVKVRKNNIFMTNNIKVYLMPPIIFHNRRSIVPLDCGTVIVYSSIKLTLSCRHQWMWRTRTSSLQKTSDLPQHTRKFLLQESGELSTWLWGHRKQWMRGCDLFSYSWQCRI